MGTNFYILGHKDNDTPEYHIGKRSAAGLYCWNCNKTLCKDGILGIHTGKSEWYDACPDCGAKPIKETLENSAAGIELGFAKNLQPFAAVTSVCSFTWAMKPSNILGKIVIIEDEYGIHYSMEGFLKMLKTICPIEYYSSIGQEFC